MGDKTRSAVHHPGAWFVGYLFVAFFANLAIPSLPASQVDTLGRLEGLALAYIAAVWVSRDSAKRGAGWPSDLTFLCSFALFPIYLLTERTWKGLFILLTVIVLLAISAYTPIILQK